MLQAPQDMLPTSALSRRDAQCDNLYSCWQQWVVVGKVDLLDWYSMWCGANIGLLVYTARYLVCVFQGKHCILLFLIRV